MFKRALIMGASIVSVAWLVGTTAEAQIISGFRVIGINSVEIESILKQLTNTRITEPAYEVVMFLQAVSARCTNPAGGTEIVNNGQPFQVENLVLGMTQIGQDFAITKNGRALSEIVFSDPSLIAAVEAASGRLCNPNWTVDKLVVHAMQVFGTLFSCEEGGDPAAPRGLPACRITDALGRQCDAPAAQDLFNTTFEYDCATVCDGVAPDGNACPQLAEPSLSGGAARRR
jgi:hypothetical protein